MIDEIEIWKSIPIFNDYEASTFGNIRSKDRIVAGKSNSNRSLKSTQLRPAKRKKGRYQVIVYKDGVRYNKEVHVLVSLAFMGKTPEGKEIDHKDNNPDNNRPDNLQFLTREENIQKYLSYRNSLSPIREGKVYFDKSKKKWTVLVYINGKRKNIGRFTQKEDALIHLQKHKHGDRC